MSWGIGGLHGKAAEEEGAELTKLLDGWERLGPVRRGTVEWDPKEGTHSVQLTTVMGDEQCFTADEFRAWSKGAAVVTRWLSGEKT